MNSPSRILSVIACVCSALFLAQAASAQSGQLTMANNYFVTGDYVVGGVGLRGLGVNGMANGQISIPDVTSVPAAGVPEGADIVAAYLYWATVETTQQGQLTMQGQKGRFNGYPITGAIRGNPNAPTSWSTGGCSGSAQGSKTMVVYRADVRPYLNVDSDGIPVGNGVYNVSLPDSGSNGGGVPLTLGASLIIIYRVHAVTMPPNSVVTTPLHSIVIYDGALAPNNSGSTITLPISGFYQAGVEPNQQMAVKLTHIVANGQPNKSESVTLNSTPLDSLYKASGLPPFPGVYNQNTISTTTGGGSWDNPTWQANGAIAAGTTAPATTVVTPSSSNSGCVNWGAVVLSTTVQDSDLDGILDQWKVDGGYVQVNPNGADFGQWVALPGATPKQKDLFVEVDYLSNLDQLAGPYQHSHLPKESALIQVGQALLRAGVHVHFDLGPVPYKDAFVIQYPVKTPAGKVAYPGAGGNLISESLLQCKDATCPYPGQVTTGWKGGVEFVQSQPGLGNFQFGRKDSYHYLLMGHGLGTPRSYWSATGMLPNVAPGLATLVSINVSGGTGTITLNNPPLVTRPRDAACNVANEPSCNLVTIEGALLPVPVGNAPLNGTYTIQSAVSNPVDNSAASTTTVTVLMPGVAPGTYDYTTEPQLGVTYGGPTSDSGFSDIGGGDSAVTFGLWLADDPPGCQADPTAAVYCVNQVGTTTAQAGTILHELGHTLFFTHGGTYFLNPQKPYVQSFGMNCNPAYQSSMNYLFQIRGFPEGGIDYSNQTLGTELDANQRPALNETALNEGKGLGLDGNSAATHYSRWYAPPDALDTQLQNSVGGVFAPFHCDGSPLANQEASMVRVDGTLFPGLTHSADIDWNHNFTFDLMSNLTAQDINFSGSSGDTSLPGFNDWTKLDLQQIGARSDAFGFSDGAGGNRVGGGGNRVGGGGNRVGGGGNRVGGGGNRVGGGGEQNTDTANSTADAPVLMQPTMNGHSVVLTWNAPEFGQIRTYTVFRALGKFQSLGDVFANRALFAPLTTLKGTPPNNTFPDATVQNNKTYTYFIVDTNQPGVQSTPSNPMWIAVKF